MHLHLHTPYYELLSLDKTEGTQTEEVQIGTASSPKVTSMLGKPACSRPPRSLQIKVRRLYLLYRPMPKIR
jgi:hypothetical protein